MATIEQSIDVEVPVSTAYNQWTQFEEFPQFMEGIESVKQLDDTRLHWVAEIAGNKEEWDARITEQTPDQCVAWKSEGGTKTAGVVKFQKLAGDKTRINLRLDYEPEGVVEKTGNALGFTERRVSGDLERFKEFIEGRGEATGAWRGQIQNN